MQILPPHYFLLHPGNRKTIFLIAVFCLTCVSAHLARNNGLEPHEESVTCDPPTNVSISNITTSSGKVSWTAASGASHYYVHYKACGAVGETPVLVSGTNYTINNLDPCTTYEVRLRSACPDGGSYIYSDFTNIENFTTANSNPAVSLSISN